MSKRKKNNELERTKRVARECLKDCAVLYVSGNKFKSLVSLKHEAQVKVTPSIDAAVHKLRWHWTVLIAAFCRAPDGVYVHQQAFDNAIECQIAKDEFNHRAELTRTTGDTLINECIDENGAPASRD